MIHSFAVPAFWFKIDAVPGRLNETSFTIEKPGVYYGQCSELCGARHGYMPIAVEAVPPAQFDAWVAVEGRHDAGRQPRDRAAAAAPQAAADAAAHRQRRPAPPSNDRARHQTARAPRNPAGAGNTD